MSTNRFQNLYEPDEKYSSTIVSAKQLFKKLNHVKEKYYCSFDPILMNEMWELKIKTNEVPQGTK